MKPGGRIALTEPIWLKPDPPPDVRRNWRTIPAMTDVPGCRDVIGRAGLKLLGDFVLPEAAWWDHYYGPLETRARSWPRNTRQIESPKPCFATLLPKWTAYRRHSAYFGYQFFVMAR